MTPMARAVRGISCMRPRAPRLELALALPRDSASIWALSRVQSRLFSMATSRKMSSYLVKCFLTLAVPWYLPILSRGVLPWLSS